MARSYRIALDVDLLEGISKRLEAVTPERLSAAVVTSINAVTERTFEFSRERMIAGINLSDSYLRRRMSVDQATRSRPEGTITASGAKTDITILGRYGAQAVIGKDRSRKGKGNKALGIAPGYKQEGVTVSVTTGSQKNFATGFLLPLRKGDIAGGNGFGVFTRSKGSKRIQNRLGPSVYQLFAANLDAASYEAEEDLATTLLVEIDKNIELDGK